LTKVVVELPKSALAWYELGIAQARLGRPEAKISFEQSIKLYPNWQPAKEALNKFTNRGFFSRFFGR
jgi:hypothetical protein